MGAQGLLSIMLRSPALMSFFFFVEFLQLLASESNEMCTREKKKTISAEHVLKAVEARTALGTLNFSANMSFRLLDFQII